MIYLKTDWLNLQAPSLNEDNLNKLEDGIEYSVNTIGEVANINPDLANNLIDIINSLHARIKVLEEAQGLSLDDTILFSLALS